MFMCHTRAYSNYLVLHVSREIMQLYSIGLCELNQDGSKVLKDGECELTYTNDEIIEYAKVWTRFTKREVRGNIESIFASDKNFLDVSFLLLLYSIALNLNHAILATKN